MATLPDFSLHIGKDKVIQVTITDEDGNAKDISGATVTMRIGDLRAGTTALEIAGVLVTPANGICSATVDKTDSATLSARTYDYQFDLVDGATDEQIVREGIVNVKAVLPDVP